MLWKDFFRANPHLRDGLDRVAKEFAREIATACGEEPLIEDEADVDLDQLLPLLVCNMLQNVKEQYLESIHARQSWTRFAATLSAGRDVVTYLNKAGEIAELPASFVDAFLAGRPLDCRIVEDEADPRRARIVRGGRVEAVVPKSLLHHLSDLRQRNDQRNP